MNWFKCKHRTFQRKNLTVVGHEITYEGFCDMCNAYVQLADKLSTATLAYIYELEVQSSSKKPVNAMGVPITVTYDGAVMTKKKGKKKMSNHAKDLRKQLRAIVQEILPAFLANEVGLEIQKKVSKDLHAYNAQKMESFEKSIKEQLEQIAARQKEVTEALKAKISELSKPKDSESK